MTKGYLLTIGRIASFKGVDLAIHAAKKLGVHLKVVGEFSGVFSEQKNIEKLAGENVEFLGRVPDSELKDLYQNATAFLALAKDEDFGITPVEAMAVGTQVIAYKGGGYLETVINGKTGVFFDEYNVESLIGAIKKFKSLTFKREDCVKQAKKFSKENFVKKMRAVILEGVAR